MYKKGLEDTHELFLSHFIFFSLICISEISGFITEHLFKYTGHESSLWQVLMAFTMTEIRSHYSITAAGAPRRNCN